jgi:hypothetical protein
MTALEQRPHALYRFFGKAGVLLYVGITASLPTRLSNHRGDKPWWTEVVDIKIAHYGNRVEVLAAEAAAIKAEKPVWNVKHNRGSASPPRSKRSLSAAERAYPHIQAWEFTSRSGHTRTEPLWLYWEVACDPISDDYYVDDISAADLWREWLTRYPCDEDAEIMYGTGAVAIHWFVEGPSTLEAAPFRDTSRDMAGHIRQGLTIDQAKAIEGRYGFLRHFSWPVHPETRQQVQWSRLPVIDKVWRTTDLPEPHAHKGGFIQEATGWKPSPLQPYVDVHRLAAVAGLYAPERVGV